MRPIERVGFTEWVDRRRKQRWFQAFDSHGALDRTGWVYFVQGADLIKIGTTRTVNKRILALCGGSPVPLKLLLVIPGSTELERCLHRQHENARAHGEWFRSTERLLSHIERLRLRRSLANPVVYETGTRAGAYLTHSRVQR